MKNKPNKLTLNQETMRSLTETSRHSAITGTCLISLCIKTTCPGV